MRAINEYQAPSVLEHCTSLPSGTRIVSIPDNDVRYLLVSTAMREIYSGFIRIHILYHASHEPIFGIGIIEELGRHGYKLSPGTLYPILHTLETNGLLTSTIEPHGRSRRRWYKVTAKGRKELTEAKQKIKELFDELFEDEKM